MTSQCYYLYSTLLSALTLIVLFLTLLVVRSYTKATKKIEEIGQSQLNVSHKNLEVDSHPWATIPKISVEFSRASPYFLYEITNIGRTPAYDVELEADIKQIDILDRNPSPETISSRKFTNNIILPNTPLILRHDAKDARIDDEDMLFFVRVNIRCTYKTFFDTSGEFAYTYEYKERNWRIIASNYKIKLTDGKWYPKAGTH